MKIPAAILLFPALLSFDNKEQKCERKLPLSPIKSTKTLHDLIDEIPGSCNHLKGVFSILNKKKKK